MSRARRILLGALLWGGAWAGTVDYQHFSTSGG
jgi:hypothetical protein